MSIKKKFKFTIQRSTWRRGDIGKGLSYLLNEEGYQCCLGFCAKALGISDEDNLRVSSPLNSVNRLERFGKPHPWPSTLVTRKTGHRHTGIVHEAANTLTCSNIIKINDSQSIEEQVRERELRTLFGDIGIEVTFED